MLVAQFLGLPGLLSVELIESLGALGFVMVFWAVKSSAAFSKFAAWTERAATCPDKCKPGSQVAEQDSLATNPTAPVDPVPTRL